MIFSTETSRKNLKFKNSTAYDTTDNQTSIIDGITTNDISSKLSINAIKEALLIRGLTLRGSNNQLTNRLLKAITKESENNSPLTQKKRFISSNIDSAMVDNKNCSKVNVKSKASLNSNTKIISFENLMGLSHIELRHLCKELLISSVGTKAELAQRLIDALFYRENGIKEPLSHRKNTNKASIQWSSLISSMSQSKVETILNNLPTFYEHKINDVNENEIVESFTAALEMRDLEFPTLHFNKLYNNAMKPLLSWEITANLEKRDLKIVGTKINKAYSLSILSLIESYFQKPHIIPTDQTYVKKNLKSTISENRCDPDLSVGIIFGNPCEASKTTMYSARAINEHLNGLPSHGMQDNLVANLPLDKIESIGGIRVVLYYISSSSCPYYVPQSQLYSNTPLELDIKALKQKHIINNPSINNSRIINLKDCMGLSQHILRHCHVLFPTTDWLWKNKDFYEMLDKHISPYLGVVSTNTYPAPKNLNFQGLMQELGSTTFMNLSLSKHTNVEENLSLWLKKQGSILSNCSLLITPNSNSISEPKWCNGIIDAACYTTKILKRNTNEKVSIERYATTERLIKFSITVINSCKGPISFLPSEIDIYDEDEEIQISDAEIHQIYGLYPKEKQQNDIKFIKALTRRRYRNITYQTRDVKHIQINLISPPRIPFSIINRVRRHAEKLFYLLKLKDYSVFNGSIIADEIDKYIRPKKAIKAFNSYSAKTILNARVSDLTLSSCDSLTSLSELKEIATQYRIDYISSKFQRLIKSDILATCISHKIKTCSDNSQTPEFLSLEKLYFCYKTYLRKYGLNKKFTEFQSDLLNETTVNTKIQNNWFKNLTLKSKFENTKLFRKFTKIKKKITHKDVTVAFQIIKLRSYLFHNFNDDKWMFRLLELKNREIRQAYWRIIAYRRSRLIFNRGLTDNTIYSHKNLFASDSYLKNYYYDSWILMSRELNDYFTTYAEKIVFHYFDIVGGFDHQSFIFQQSIKLGITHSILLLYLINGTTKPSVLSNSTHQCKEFKGSDFGTLRGVRLATRYGSFRPEQNIVATYYETEHLQSNNSKHSRLSWEIEIEKDERLFMALQRNIPIRGFKKHSLPNVGYYGKYYANNTNHTHIDFILSKTPTKNRFSDTSNILANKISKKDEISTSKSKNKFEYQRLNSKKSLSSFSTKFGQQNPKINSTVWLLCGRGMMNEDNSLLSGVHIYLNLAKLPGLRVEIFFITPLNSSKKDKGRHSRSLSLRNKQMLLGLPHYMIDDVFHKTAIKRPSQIGRITFSMRPIWAVPLALALRYSFNDVHEECELWCEIQAKHISFLSDNERAVVDIHNFAQFELESNRVRTLNGFNSRALETLPKPRQLDLGTLASEAHTQNATIFLVAPGIGENGQIQSLLDEYEVPYTGCGSKETKIMSDKHEMYLNLEGLRKLGIGSAVTQIISYDEIADILIQDPTCEYCYKYFQQLLSKAKNPISIRPETYESSKSITMIENHRDLYIYFRAILDGHRMIPAGTLTNSHEDIKLPGMRCNYLLESSLNTCSVFKNSPRKDEHESFLNSCSHIKIIVGLIGDKNNMRALDISLATKEIDSPSLPESLKLLIPNFKEHTKETERIPGKIDKILTTEKQESIRNKIELVAKKLGISGVATLEALVALETGHIIVTDLILMPEMSSYSTLIQQAASASPAIMSREFYTKILECSYDNKLKGSDRTYTKNYHK